MFFEVRNIVWSSKLRTLRASLLMSFLFAVR